MSDEIILRKVQALGIPDPLKASAETVKVVLSAYFTKKLIDEGTFRGYMGTLNPSLAILMDGLKAFSMDQAGLSHKVLNHVELAINVLKTRLERPDITPQEATEIRFAILDLIREARDEANQQRIITVGLMAFATTALVAVAGGIMAAMTDQKRDAGNLRLPSLRDR